MRFINTVAIFSVTVLATNHGNWNKGMSQYGDYQQEYQPSPQPVVESPTPDYVPPMAHETTTVMMHETTPAAEQEPPMAHETSTVMMHDTTSMEAPMHTTPPSHEVDMTTPAAGPMTHTVTVGGDAGLVYTPSEIKAAVGDIVQFVFHKQNHSVTQSTFDKPCNRLETGEDSGLLPNPNNTVVPAPIWAYTVKEAAPSCKSNKFLLFTKAILLIEIYLGWYCKQRTGTHCGKGMVFAINPTVEKSLNLFKEKAIMLNGTAAITTTTAPPQNTVTNVASTVTLISEPTGTPPPPATDKPYIVPGWNEGNAGACNCACFCGVGTFPKGNGIGHFGGVGGSMPAPWK